MKVDCPVCDGDGAVKGTRWEHACDGTDKDCAKKCPVQAEAMENCGDCGGTGEVGE